jgi:chaperonin GroES
LNRGEVVAVGPGSTESPVTLKAGDKVILPGFGGASVKLDKDSTEELLIYREADILAKLSE